MNPAPRDELKESLLVRTCCSDFTSLFYRNLLARVCTLYFVCLEGILTGIWSISLSDVQDQHQLSDSLLGVASMIASTGTVATLPVTGYCLKTYGSQTTVLVGGILYSLFLLLIALSDSYATLLVFMFIYGLMWGTTDISANTSSIVTEVVAEKSLLGSYHGSYSLSAATGSFVGAIMKSDGIKLFDLFLIISMTCATLCAVFIGGMYSHLQEDAVHRYNHRMDEVDRYNHRMDEVDRNKMSSPYAPMHPSMEESRDRCSSPGDDRHSNRNDDRIDSPLLLHVECSDEPTSDAYEDSQGKEPEYMVVYLSLLSFLAAFGEGSVVTWSAIYYDKVLHSSSLLRTLGFSCFMVAMASGRFSCDFLRARYGRKAMVFTGSLLMLSGLVLVVAAPDMTYCIEFASIGFTVTGLGLSTLMPIAFSSAGHLKDSIDGSTALTIIAGFSYAGSIVNAPVIGLVSDLSGSLRYGIVCDLIVLSCLVPLSMVLPKETSRFLSSTNNTHNKSSWKSASTAGTSSDVDSIPE